MFTPVKNPSDREIHDLIKASAHGAARRITDQRNGDVWYWPAEQATHSEGAQKLDVPYDKPPGGGDIVVL